MFHVLHPKMEDLSRLSYPGNLGGPLSKARSRLAGKNGNTKAILTICKCSNKLIKHLRLRFLAKISCFRKKTPSQIFDWVLNMPLLTG